MGLPQSSHAPRDVSVRLLAMLLTRSLALLVALLCLIVTPALAVNYSDNGDGTLTDPTTGLTWMRCSVGQTWDGSTCAGMASTYTWDQAVALTGTVTFAGQSDWRLPNIPELQSIVDRSYSYPAFNTAAFPNTLSSSGFWSASAFARDLSSAWVVYSSIGSAWQGSKSSAYQVRLVRAGQSLGLLNLARPTSDYVDHGDGTVTHTPTGLVWKQCAEGQAWYGGSCSGTPSAYTWNDANLLTSTFAGQSDWRLPTEEELLSLVDYTRYIPSINTTLFPNTWPVEFWSASAYAHPSSYRWFVSFYDGMANNYDTAYGSFRVRLVRAGQPLGSLAVPDAPTIGTATAGNAQATISFTAPWNNGGTTITSYTVTPTPGGFTATGTVSPITVTGLTNGTAYTFAVTATNSAGTGAASTSSNSVTPSAPASFGLSVLVSGSGTVASDIGGISCVTGGEVCSANIASATLVTLTATPASSFGFGGWSGACTGLGQCLVTMDAAKSVTATFVAQSVSVTLPFRDDFTGAYSAAWQIRNPQPANVSTISSPGALTINTTGTDIFAGTSNAINVFTVPVPAGTDFTVTAKLNFPTLPSSNYQQGGIIIFGSAGGQPDVNNWIRTSYGYIVDGRVVQSVWEQSASPTITEVAVDTSTVWLRIVKNGASYTTAYSTDGVNFSNHVSNQPMTLAGSVLHVGLFAMNGSTAAASIPVEYDYVEIIDNAAPAQFNLLVTASGVGTVTSEPATISCASGAGVCVANFTSGSVVTLTATPDAGYAFSGWSGACTGLGQCLVTMDAAKSVTANFILMASAPGAPTIGTATAGNAQATVTFAAPASNGGAAITSYTVTSTPGGFTATGTVSPITVTGLTNGTAYTFAVTATNSAGTGAASAASNAVIPSKASQTVSFGTAPAIVVGGTGTVSATATSGLAVSYSSTTASVCTISGSTVTGVAAGTCTIAADQAGDTSYNAAAQVAQSITVGRGSQTTVPRFAYVANSSSSDISVYSIDPSTGALTAGTATVAAGSSPTSVAVDPSGRFAYVADANSDSVLVYTIDQSTGALTAGTAVAAGSVPTSVTIDPSGRFAYVFNQGSFNFSVYTIDQSTGALTAVAGSPFTLGSGFSPVTVDPFGKFAYITNGSGSVSAYTINQSTGALTAVAGSPFAAGSAPWSVAVDPYGKFAYVANYNSNDVSVYTINQSTGALTAGTAVAAGANPSSVAVDSSGQFAYVANSGSSNVSVYTIDQSTGALTAGTAVAAGQQPTSVIVTADVSIQTTPRYVTADAGSGWVALRWTYVPGATSYNVYYSTTAGVGTAGTKISGATNGAAITGLSGDTNYFFAVTAVSAGNESTLSGEAIATPIAPATPRFVYVANYVSSRVSVFAINPTTGALTAGTAVAAGGQSISVSVDPSGRFAYAANMGSNNVSVYAIAQSSGALFAGTSVVSGSSPRSVAVDPSGRFVYVANFGSNNISAYAIDQSTGALTAVAGSPFVAGTNSISVSVNPSGRFAYVTNYGSNNVSVYAINQSTGALTSIAGSPFAAGSHPYTVAVDPYGKFAYVANVTSNNVSVYAIDQSTGALTAVAGSPFAAGTAPHSVAIDPSGRFAYVANYTSNNVSVYTINQSTGALTAGTAVAAGTNPSSVAVDPSGKFAYVANYGSTYVSVFAIDQSTGALTAGTAVATGTGTGSFSVAVTAGVSIPATPRIATAVAANSAATLSWAYVAGATSYNVYYGTTAGAGTAGTKISGAMNGGAITGLASGAAYYFVVTAVNAMGESAISDEVSATPLVVPDAFAFTSQTNAALSTVTTSNSITVSGINAAAAISITGGEYSVNGGPYTSAPGTVTNGQSVAVHLISAGTYNMTLAATLTIGGVSSTFNVTTASKADQTIGAISFSPSTLAVGGTTTAGATATSGLALSYSSTTPSVCTVSGSTVAGITAGTCTIAANQAGSASYNAAPQVMQSITVAIAQCVPQASGLVSWWSGEDNANDTVGNNNGTLMNGATFATGRVGQAFSLNGTNDYVSVPGSSAWAFGANDFSIDLWAKFNAVRSGSHEAVPNVFVGQDEGSNNLNKWVFFLADDGLNFHINGPVSAFIGQIPFSPVAGQWYHLAVSRSGSTYSFFVNGALAGTAVDANPIPEVNAPLTIGQVEGLGYFNGLLDEIQIYNRALSASEIQAIYSAASAGTCVPDTVPDAFAFAGQTGISLSTVATSNAITVTGIDTASPISITGGEYSINGGAYTRAPGTLANGQSVTVRLTSAGASNTTLAATLIIGGVSSTFTVTTVGTASQTISAIGFLPTTLAAGGTTTASATATSGLPVSFSTATPSVCTVSGSTVTGVTAGTCTIAANQAGSANYTTAPQVTQNITVGKANQSLGAISFTPSALAVGGTTTVSATASSGLTASFSTSTPLVCSVSGSTVTGVSAGTCTIAANQAGNANYAAAAQVTQNISVGQGTQSINFVQGWNLVGNGSDAPIDVAATFSDANRFLSVWKWVAAQAAWGFYAPSLATQGGAVQADYAVSKGYQVLTTIAGGEGFWVNAAQAGSVNVPNGNAISVATLGPTLIEGWNLISVGETATPKQFCDAQSGGVTTLWAWDSTNSVWYFYAPSLDANGGLSNYITGRGYFDFTANNKSLGSGVGFWVNKP